MDCKVGIQLFSVRNEMMKNPTKAIEKVVEIGYKNLEVANHRAADDPGVGFGVPAKEMKETLDKLGAHIFSAHVNPLNEETCKRVIEYHQTIGNHILVMPMDFFSGRDDVLRKCERYNKIGSICKQEGMIFLYHNHFHEFQILDGEQVFRLLMENTDPANMGFELDTFWCMRGGQDPVETMKKLGSRLRLVHQKDFSKTTASPVNAFEIVPQDQPVDMQSFQKAVKPEDFVEIGTGRMDIQAIIDTACALGSVEYVVLEQDQSCHGELESIQISMDNFKKYRGIVW